MAVRGIFLFITIRIFSILGAKEDTDFLPFKKMDAAVLQMQSDVHLIRRTLTEIKEIQQRVFDNNWESTALHTGTSAANNDYNDISEVIDRRKVNRITIASLYVKTVETSNDVKTLVSKMDKMLKNIDECDKRQEECEKPRSCLELLRKGYTLSGVYKIFVAGLQRSLEVYCDQSTEGGGWIVFQRRKDGSVDFYRDWKDYKNGFGQLEGEFWMGNDIIHHLTSPVRFELRIDMQDFEYNRKYAQYETFMIGPEAKAYMLTVEGYSGSAGDSFGMHSGRRFSSKDVDNDAWDINSCAKKFKGAWWYVFCHKANLNGQYLRGAHTSYADGIEWYTWKGYNYSLKSVEMKIREVSDN